MLSNCLECSCLFYSVVLNAVMVSNVFIIQFINCFLLLKSFVGYAWEVSTIYILLLSY